MKQNNILPTKEQVILVLNWLRSSGMNMNEDRRTTKRWKDGVGAEFTSEETAEFFFHDLLEKPAITAKRFKKNKL
jgi:hypothetical protein